MYSSKQAAKYLSQGVFFLALATLAPGVVAEQGYSYSEYWAVVSAPPPPGPYRPVNLDPRVPGQGAVSSIMMDIPMSEHDRSRPPAPAAGQVPPPVEATIDPGRQSAGPAMQYPAPPRYGMRPGYPQPPVRYPQSAPRYGGGMQPPPPGYYGADRYHPNEVPPPDVYDAMQGRR